MHVWVQIDADGQIVREAASLSPFWTLPDGHQWILTERPTPHATWDTVARQWVVPLETAKRLKWEAIKAERSAREYGGFEWDGSRFDSDSESQRRIQGAAQLAMLAAGAGQPFSIDWTLEDNTVRTLSATDMISVGAALGQYVSSLYAVSRALRAAVEAAQTPGELDAIEWP